MLSRTRYWLFLAVLASASAASGGSQAVQATAPQDRSATRSETRTATMRDLHNTSSVPVTEYGAVGNCSVKGSTSSCTDNTAAIQNAFNYCYSNRCAVYFPASYGATSTVYYVASTIDPKGVPFFGPPGAAGEGNGQPSVSVRGAPAKDVFAVGDPASKGYVHPMVKFAVRDIGIVPDDTVDASSSGTNSFPNRLPGRTCFDASISMSTPTILTSSGQCYFQPGDVGQIILIYGAGSAGTNLSTTVASYQSLTQVTLTTAASTAVTKAHAYVAVMGMSATQTLGNCGFAYDDSATSGGEDAYGVGQTDFTNVQIRTNDDKQINNTCAAFFQGAAAEYQDLWEHFNIAAEFGIMHVPSNGVAPGPMCAGMCDFNVYRDGWINAPYPFLAYGGNANKLESIELATVEQGPNILDAKAPASTPGEYVIDIGEEEEAPFFGDACQAGWTAYRIAGSNHSVNRLGTPFCHSGTMGFQWDASNSRIDDFFFATLGPINIAGSLNTFRSSVALNPHGWNVTGYGNTFVTCASMNPLDSVQAGRCQYAGLNAANVGPALLSRGSIAFNRTHDFIDKGAIDYYLNGEDLWFWPSEVGAVGGAPALVNDPESDTGTAINLATGAGSKVLTESNGVVWKVGSQIPAGPIRIYFKAKTSGQPADFYVDALDGAPNPAHSLGCHTTVTLKSAYGVFYCDVNTSEAYGSRFGIQLGNGRGLRTNVEIAWIGIRPWTTDFPTASLQIGSGAAITGNQGNGSYLLHSTGKATPGDLIAFDNNGNAVDSGIPASKNSARSGGEGGEADPASPGDLLCAHAADKTIHAVAITGSPVCNGTSCILNGSAISADYAIPGQLIGVTGTSGVAGLNGGPYQLTSYRRDSVTFNYNAASGTPSGGAFYRWCENQNVDATAMTVFSKASIQIPANFLQKQMNYQHRAQMLLTTAAEAPEFSVQMSYGPASLYRASFDMSANQVNNPSQLTVNMLPLGVGDSGVIESSLQSFTLAGSNPIEADPGIQTYDTSVDQSIQVNAAFAATGVASVVSASGGAISDAGTCKLAGFNGGGTGAAALVRFTHVGSWNGAAFTISDTGYGYKSAPTTAVLSSGTAQCSGTVALVTQLGGAQGNAVELVGLQ